jgi:DNA-binding PadR family transcriptional regulator
MSVMDISPPLTPAVFSILLALATGDKHGYAIMKRVREDSNGTVKMGNGTLYGSLKRMLADGLIGDAGDRIDPELDDERRRYYRLTKRGQQVLNAEMQRYVDTVALLRRRNLLAPASAEGER